MTGSGINGVALRALGLEYLRSFDCGHLCVVGVNVGE